jgi:hypothetical protein
MDLISVVYGRRKLVVYEILRFEYSDEMSAIF